MDKKNCQLHFCHKLITIKIEDCAEIAFLEIIVRLSLMVGAPRHRTVLPRRPVGNLSALFPSGND